MDSDDDLRRHCLDDMARQQTCQVIFKPSKQHLLTWQVVAVCCRPSWMELVTWRCHVVVVVGVVERLSEVVVETKQRWWTMVVEKESICLFTMCM